MSGRFHVAIDATQATITFDDGGMNLLSAEALRELRIAISALADVPVLIFRSGRPSIFAAGADMQEMSRFSGEEAERFSELGQSVFEAIARLPLLTIAVIEGDCFGGALDLALAFDLRLATLGSRFSHPGSRIGIVTGFGGTARWSSTVHGAGARRLFLGNEILTVEAAREIGLVDEIVESPAIDVKRFAVRALSEVRLIKELTTHTATLTDAQALLLAARLGQLYSASKDQHGNH
ncbi:MAG TPA: enoyl-CoA hydratase/isomerase family protein [Thermoanaerobaculia bacterium]|nr:enoyl-CoA hydratase/isomerase family protein [Thermoanaerobaculia bacterium]